MTDAELRVLAENATPGPWRRGCWDDPFGVGSIQPGYGMVAVTAGGIPESESESAVADADFIAASRTAIPRLLAELAEFHAECDKVGIPYDAEGLVRHHRGNAGLAAALNADTTARQEWKAERGRLLAETRMPDALNVYSRSNLSRCCGAWIAWVTGLGCRCHPGGWTCMKCGRTNPERGA